MTDRSPTFKERFSEIFEILEGRGYEPEWQPMAECTNWNPHTESSGVSSSEIIKCTTGPIMAVALWTEKLGESDETISWYIYREVLFRVRLDWPTRRVPGINLLSVQVDTNGHWNWNDLGLGIIERLNGLPQPEGVLQATQIRVRPIDVFPSPRWWSHWETQMDNHHVADYAIEIICLGKSITEYGGGGGVPRGVPGKFHRKFGARASFR